MIMQNKLAFLFLSVSVALYLLCKNHFTWSNGEFTFEDADNIDDYKGRYDEKKNFHFYDVFIPVYETADHAVIHAWLLIPRHSPTSAPVVLLSHGLGAQKDMGLMNYGEYFAKAGYCVLIMDYRYFGGSYSRRKVSSVMRNLIDPWNHVKDIKVVLRAFVQGNLYGSKVELENGQRISPVTLERADRQRIMLWGTSFAGGHMLQVAKDLAGSSIAIKGIIAQVPHLDGKAASKRAVQSRGVIGVMRVAVLAVADLILSEVMGLPPVYVKIVGSDRETSYMTLSDEQLTEYFKKHPKTYLGSWKNLAPVRTMAKLSLYNPITCVDDITVPILFIAATQDHLCPIEYVRAALELKRDNRSRLLEIDSSHFGLYRGDNFDFILSSMVAFLDEILPVYPTSA